MLTSFTAHVSPATAEPARTVDRIARQVRRAATIDRWASRLLARSRSLALLVDAGRRAQLSSDEWLPQTLAPRSARARSLRGREVQEIGGEGSEVVHGTYRNHGIATANPVRTFSVLAGTACAQLAPSLSRAATPDLGTHFRKASFPAQTTSDKRPLVRMSAPQGERPKGEA